MTDETTRNKVLNRILIWMKYNSYLNFHAPIVYQSC